MKQARKLIALVSTMSLGLMGRAAAADIHTADHHSASTINQLNATLSAAGSGGDTDGSPTPPPPGS